MRRDIMHVVVLACCAAMAGVAVQAEEDKTAPAAVQSRVNEERLNVQALQVLDARGGFIRLEGRSLFLTSNVGEHAQTGYWFDVGPDPRRPSLVCGSLPGAWDVGVAGEYAFVCDYTKFLAVYDMRDRHWQQTARLEMASMTENIIIRAKLAYVANHVAGLTIVDISTPSKPSIVSNFNPHIDCDAIGLWHDCAILYGHWESRLVLVDVSDPAKPRQTGVYQNDSKTFNQGEMAVDGGFAYCTAMSGLVIVNIADQNNPKLAKAVDLNGPVSDVVVADGYAFLAAGPRGVLVLDVSDTGAPHQIGCYKARKGFAASQIAVQRAARVHDAAVPRTESSEKAVPCAASASGHAAPGLDTDYLIYVANSQGPAIVLLFRAPVRRGGCEQRTGQPG